MRYFCSFLIFKYFNSFFEINVIYIRFIYQIKAKYLNLNIEKCV